MLNRDIDDIKKLANKIKKLNAKVKIIALLEKAKKEFEQNNLFDCKSSCEELLIINPNNPTALRGLGCVMQAQGKNLEAINYYNEALKYSLNKEIEYTLIGNLYYKEEKLDEAIKYFNLAINYNDNYEAAYEGRNQAMLENHLKIIDLQEQLIKRNIF